MKKQLNLFSFKNWKKNMMEVGQKAYSNAGDSSKDEGDALETDFSAEK